MTTSWEIVSDVGGCAESGGKSGMCECRRSVERRGDYQPCVLRAAMRCALDVADGVARRGGEKAEMACYRARRTRSSCSGSAQGEQLLACVRGHAVRGAQTAPVCARASVVHGCVVLCALDRDVDESAVPILKVETSCVAKQCLCVVPCVNSKHCDAVPLYLFVFRSTWISFSTH